MTTKLAAAALVLLPTIASAQTYVATDGYAKPASKTPASVDARLGMMLGGSDVGDADGFSLGASGALGYRTGDITARALFDYFRVGDGADETLSRHGRAMRIGGALRYAFASTDRDAKDAADFWGELGVGYEHVTWRRGGILDRPSGEIAIGLDYGRRGEPNERGQRREIGYFMAFRTLVAQGPEMEGAMVTCSGPCSEATKPPRTDVSMFFELGVHWGR